MSYLQTPKSLKQKTPNKKQSAYLRSQLAFYQERQAALHGKLIHKRDIAEQMPQYDDVVLPGEEQSRQGQLVSRTSVTSQAKLSFDQVSFLLFGAFVFGILRPSHAQPIMITTGLVQPLNTTGFDISVPQIPDYLAPRAVEDIPQEQVASKPLQEKPKKTSSKKPLVDTDQQAERMSEVMDTVLILQNNMLKLDEAYIARDKATAEYMKTQNMYSVMKAQEDIRQLLGDNLLFCQKADKKFPEQIAFEMSLVRIHSEMAEFYPENAILNYGLAIANADKVMAFSAAQNTDVVLTKAYCQHKLGQTQAALDTLIAQEAVLVKWGKPIPEELTKRVAIFRWFLDDHNSLHNVQNDKIVQDDSTSIEEVQTNGIVIPVKYFATNESLQTAFNKANEFFLQSDFYNSHRVIDAALIQADSMGSLYKIHFLKLYKLKLSMLYQVIEESQLIQASSVFEAMRIAKIVKMLDVLENEDSRFLQICSGLNKLHQVFFNTLHAAIDSHSRAEQEVSIPLTTGQKIVSTVGDLQYYFRNAGTTLEQWRLEAGEVQVNIPWRMIGSVAVSLAGIVTGYKLLRIGYDFYQYRSRRNAIWAHLNACIAAPGLNYEWRVRYDAESKKTIYEIERQKISDVLKKLNLNDDIKNITNFIKQFLLFKAGTLSRGKGGVYADYGSSLICIDIHDDLFPFVTLNKVDIQKLLASNVTPEVPPKPKRKKHHKKAKKSSGFANNGMQPSGGDDEQTDKGKETADIYAIAEPIVRTESTASAVEFDETAVDDVGKVVFASAGEIESFHRTRRALEQRLESWQDIITSLKQAISDLDARLALIKRTRERLKAQDRELLENIEKLCLDIDSISQQKEAQILISFGAEKADLESQLTLLKSWNEKLNETKVFFEKMPNGLEDIIRNVIEHQPRPEIIAPSATANIALIDLEAAGKIINPGEQQRQQRKHKATKSDRLRRPKAMQQVYSAPFAFAADMAECISSLRIRVDAIKISSRSGYKPNVNNNCMFLRFYIQHLAELAKQSFQDARQKQPPVPQLSLTAVNHDAAYEQIETLRNAVTHYLPFYELPELLALANEFISGRVFNVLCFTGHANFNSLCDVLNKANACGEKCNQLVSEFKKATITNEQIKGSFVRTCEKIRQLITDIARDAQYNVLRVSQNVDSTARDNIIFALNAIGELMHEIDIRGAGMQDCYEQIKAINPEFFAMCRVIRNYIGHADSIEPQKTRIYSLIDEILGNINSEHPNFMPLIEACIAKPENLMSIIEQIEIRCSAKSKLEQSWVVGASEFVPRWQHQPSNVVSLSMFAQEQQPAPAPASNGPSQNVTSEYR